MIGPDGVGTRDSPQDKSVIQSVHATDRDVWVVLGDDVIGLERIRVEMRLAFGSGKPEVTVRWSGTSNSEIEYAEHFSHVLQQANLLAHELQGLVTDRTSAWWDDPNPEITKGIIGGRSDYMLCAYLILNGTAAFYVRGAERNDEQRARGVNDLESLRTVALRIINEKAEVT